MPVSKKRKKDGKPVHRAVVAPAPGEEHLTHPDAPVAAQPTPHGGRPTNPFVAQQTRRGAQRGR